MKQFSATITTRYNAKQEDIYNEVMGVVKEHNIPKSTAQFLLVEKGVQHKNNPSPLVIPKPKVIVKKEVVYKDKPPIEKVVYKDRVVYKDKPEQEHLNEHIPAQPTPPHSVATQDTPMNNKASITGNWTLGVIIGGLISYGVCKWARIL